MDRRLLAHHARKRPVRRLTVEALEPRWALSGSCNGPDLGNTARDDVLAVLQGVAAQVAAPDTSPPKVGDYTGDQRADLADLVYVQTYLKGRVYGSAPDPPYPTLPASDGASHEVSRGFEITRVQFVGPLVAGMPGAFDIATTGCGFVTAWVDFAGDGIWQDDDRIAGDSLDSTSGRFSFDTPQWAVATPPGGATWARFRFSDAAAGNLRPTGLGGVGDVVDLSVEISASRGEKFDFGDAPATYQTFQQDAGAFHGIRPGFHLGTSIDGELDGIPTADADGDDLDGLDDEDGVVFLTPLLAGRTAEVRVTVASPADLAEAWVTMWLDANADRQFNSNENPRAFAVQNGSNVLQFPIPIDVRTDVPTILRVRLSSQQILEPTGLALDGEVEDYQLRFSRPAADFGDAPAPIPTLRGESGPLHELRNDYYLGTSVDAEANGQPTADASGDDSTAVDDENGVVFNTPLVAGLVLDMDITASQAGHVTVFVGDVSRGLSRAGTPVAVEAGVNRVRAFMDEAYFAAPLPSQAIVRVRYSSVPMWDPTGAAPDGEVEDFALPIFPRPDDAYDFGDAPLCCSGESAPRHIVVPGVHLGAGVDGEPARFVGEAADGDDLDGMDDEDGVRFLTPFVAGLDATIEVTASRAGTLWACFTFRPNGACQVFPRTALNEGVNILRIPVSASAEPTWDDYRAYARFRFSTASVIEATGVAFDGEIEDYTIEILPWPNDFGDAPIPGDTARHKFNPGWYLGSTVDGEGGPQPTALADGDDTNGSDDDDGVRFLSPLTPGSDVSIEVTASAIGRLTAWIDADADGDWEALSVIGGMPVLEAGPNIVSFRLWSTTRLGPTYMRFRFAYAGISVPWGFAGDGEVEDYAVVIGTTGEAAPADVLTTREVAGIQNGITASARRIVLVRSAAGVDNLLTRIEPNGPRRTLRATRRPVPLMPYSTYRWS
jgi:hypothetical protein